MRKCVITGLLASLAAILLQPVPGRAADHTENMGGVYTAADGRIQQAADFDINDDGVLATYKGKDEIVTVPDGVTSIGECAFGNSTFVKRVILPDTVTEISTEAFAYCHDLIAVEGGSLKRIGNAAFYENFSLREIDLSKAEIIEQQAFQECLMLESVNLEAAELLETYAFLGCTNLKTVTGLGRLQVIGNNVFLRTKLREVYSEDETKGVLWIANGILLMGHHSTGTVVIPDSVTKIAPLAFEGGLLEKVIIPDAVNEIGPGAFDNCVNLTSVCDAHGVLVKYCGREKIVTVPDGVTRIEECAFEGNEFVETVILPDTVEEIGSRAFRGCSGLAVVEGGSLSRIENTAFCSSSLQKIDLSKAKIIEDAAFKDCRMLEAANLEAAEILGREVFMGCKNLETVTGLEHLQEIGHSVFLHTQLWEDYWKDEAKGDLWIVNRILLCGHHCTGTVVIPDNVKKIASEAFRSPDGIESKLEKVIIPDSVTEIGTGAFEYCRALTTVRMEDSVTKIGQYAFWGCKKLTDIRLSNALTEIDSVFAYCKALERLTLPASLKRLGKHAFEHCTKLKTLTIPPQLEEFAYNVNVVDYSKPLAQTVYVTDIAQSKKLDGTIKISGTKVAELKLAEENVVLGIGSKFALRFNSGAKAERWRSSNKKIVAVDSVGNLYAVSTGTATITATIYGKEYKCKVTVK